MQVDSQDSAPVDGGPLFVGGWDRFCRMSKRIFVELQQTVNVNFSSNDVDRQLFGNSHPIQQNNDLKDNGKTWIDNSKSNRLSTGKTITF
jgi:hypothetical protein